MKGEKRPPGCDEDAVPVPTDLWLGKSSADVKISDYCALADWYYKHPDQSPDFVAIAATCPFATPATLRASLKQFVDAGFMGAEIDSEGKILAYWTNLFDDTTEGII